MAKKHFLLFFSIYRNRNFRHSHMGAGRQVPEGALGQDGHIIAVEGEDAEGGESGEGEGLHAAQLVEGHDPE